MYLSEFRELTKHLAGDAEILIEAGGENQPLRMLSPMPMRHWDEDTGDPVDVAEVWFCDASTGCPMMRVGNAADEMTQQHDNENKGK